MDLASDLWTGLIIGFVVGVLIGIALEDSYEILKAAIIDRERMRQRKKDERGAVHSGDRRLRTLATRLKSWWLGLTTIGIVLIFIAAIQVTTGLFSVITYSQLTNFVECQGTYNQGTAEARRPRIEADKVESDALYAWLETLPPLVSSDRKNPPTPEQIKAFRHNLKKAIRTHQDNVEAQKANPYPKDPEDTCGGD